MSSRFKNRVVKESKTFTSQFISYGVKQLKIVDVEIFTSPKEAARMLHTFKVETPAIPGDFEGFEREDGTVAEGLIGNVKYDAWFNPTLGDDSDKIDQFLDDMTLIAEKAGVREQLNEIPVEMPWKEMIAEFVKIMKDKFVWFVIATEEYDENKFNYSFASIPTSKNDDNRWNFTIIAKHADFHKTGKFLRDDKDNIIEVTGTNIVGENEGKKDTIRFDTKYHYKAYESSDMENNLDLDIDPSIGGDDLPF